MVANAYPSDRYLAGKKGRQACIDALRWLRGIPADHPYMLAEVHAIFQQIDAEAAITEGNGLRAQLAEMAKPTNLKRLYIGCAMFTLMQMAGSNAINYYSPAIFKSVGLAGSDTSFFATCICDFSPSSPPLFLWWESLAPPGPSFFVFFLWGFVPPPPPPHPELRVRLSLSPPF